MKDNHIVYVGIDWSTEFHQVCVLNEDGNEVWTGSVDHTADALGGLCSRLVVLGGGVPSAVRVAIEVPRGSVVETLIERGFEVYAINPKQLDRFRDRFTMAGAKDDRLDALVLASSLRTDRGRYRLLEIDDPDVIELREWSRMHEELTTERRRLVNRMRGQIRRYFPSFLEVNPDIGTPWMLALWRHVPTPERAQKVQARSIARLLKDARVRRVTGRQVRDILRTEQPYVAPGTVAAAQAHLEQLVARVDVVNVQLKRCTSELRLRLKAMTESDGGDAGHQREQHDVTILSSLPGVGPIVHAVLLAEASGPLKRRDYHALRSLSGVAPVTRRRGRSGRVLMRKGCNHRLRDALYHWSRVAAQRDELCKRRYKALRARGHSHGRALRTVGDRLLRIACAMLTNRTTYQQGRVAQPSLEAKSAA